MNGRSSSSPSGVTTRTLPGLLLGEQQACRRAGTPCSSGRRAPGAADEARLVGGRGAAVQRPRHQRHRDDRERHPNAHHGSTVSRDDTMAGSPRRREVSMYAIDHVVLAVARSRRGGGAAASRARPRVGAGRGAPAVGHRQPHRAARAGLRGAHRGRRPGGRPAPRRSVGPCSRSPPTVVIDGSRCAWPTPTSTPPPQRLGLAVEPGERARPDGERLRWRGAGIEDGASRRVVAVLHRVGRARRRCIRVARRSTTTPTCSASRASRWPVTPRGCATGSARRAMGCRSRSSTATRACVRWSSRPTGGDPIRL